MTRSRLAVQRDVEVRARHDRYVLKLYRFGGWSIDEVMWEGELVEHLHDDGVPVAKVRRLTSGHLAGEVAAPEGQRPFTLSEYVEIDFPP